MLLELLHAGGHNLKKNDDDAYQGPCPWCGGRKRFLVWVEMDRYCCRKCSAQGDAIQYLRLYRRMGYFEAAVLTGNQNPARFP